MLRDLKVFIARIQEISMIWVEIILLKFLKVFES